MGQPSPLVPLSEQDRDTGTTIQNEATPADSPSSGLSPLRSGASNSRRLMVLLVVAFGVFAGLYGAGRVPRRRRQDALDEAVGDSKERLAAVNVIQPTVAPGVTKLSLPAAVHAYFATTLFARTSGYVNRWFVDIGDRVKSGQLLASIDAPELEQQLMEATAKVHALEAEVRLAEAQAGFAQNTSQRWEAAAPDGTVSQQERDEKQSQSANALARLDAARAQLELGKASVKRLKFETSFENVVAPFDGVITQRHVDVGSLITAGSTASTTPLFAIAQYDQVRIFVKVPQAAVPSVHVGMDANITAREYVGRNITGKVERTSGAIDPATRTLNVEVVAPNTDLVLLPGMYVTVDLQIVRREPQFIIQAGSLNLRTDGPQVAIVGPDHRVHFKNVEVARDLGDTVEISGGLRGDEWLALNISDEIAEGDAVNPIPVDNDRGRLAQQPIPSQSRESSHESSSKSTAPPGRIRGSS